jgi:hypothetical protein
MSFQNYENFPNQQGQQDGGVPGSGAPQQDTTMGGQMPDNSVAIWDPPVDNSKEVTQKQRYGKSLSHA